MEGVLRNVGNVSLREVSSHQTINDPLAHLSIHGIGVHKSLDKEFVFTMNTFQCLRFICGWIPHHRWHRVFDGRLVWYFSQHMLATATFPGQDKGTSAEL